MADLDTILKRLESLEREVRTLKSAAPAAGSFDDLPPDAVVGKDYVAHRFGCSVRAILNGEAGTGDIPRFSNSPLKFIKRAVDAAFAKRAKIPVRKRAAMEIKKAKTRRYSIIGKNHKSEKSL